ncbi:MAG: succinate dehydrogenase [Pseudomonadota bacterium]
MKHARRNHLAYGAFLLHRLSGLGLAVFLPLHFFVLGLALEKGAAFHDAIAWSAAWPVKAAEFGLVILLALHLLGGLRLLVLELWPSGAGFWAKQRALIITAFGLSLTAGLAFALSAGT